MENTTDIEIAAIDQDKVRRGREREREGGTKTEWSLLQTIFAELKHDDKINDEKAVVQVSPPPPPSLSLIPLFSFRQQSSIHLSLVVVVFVFSICVFPSLPITMDCIELPTMRRLPPIYLKIVSDL